MKITILSAFVLCLLGCVAEERPAEALAGDVAPAGDPWYMLDCRTCAEMYDEETCREYDQTCIDVESGTRAVLCTHYALDGENGCFPFPSGSGYCCCAKGQTCPGLWP